MSYEAFSGLCWKSADDLLSGQGHHDLERMAERLQELGCPLLARETNDLLQLLADLNGEVERRIDHLRSIWRAVDGYDSCDWDEKNFQEALAEYRASCESAAQAVGGAMRIDLDCDKPPKGWGRVQCPDCGTGYWQVQPYPCPICHPAEAKARLEELRTMCYHSSEQPTSEPTTRVAGQEDKDNARKPGGLT